MSKHVLLVTAIVLAGATSIVAAKPIPPKVPIVIVSTDDCCGGDPPYCPPDAPDCKP